MAVYKAGYGLGLGGRRNHAEQSPGRHQPGNRDRHGIFRNLVHGCKAAVIDLLLAADRIQLYWFYQPRVLKISHRRVVKCHMSIFPHAQDADIDGMLF